MESLIKLLNSFSIAEKRGKYSADDVNLYISSVKRELERVKKEYDSLKQKNEEYQSKASYMANALIAAEQSSKKIIDEANREADVIRANARKEGDDYINEMNNRAAALENEINVRKEEFNREFQNLNSIRSSYQKTIMSDIEELVSKLNSMSSVSFIDDLSDEVKDSLGLSSGSDDSETDAPEFDMTRIVKEMPADDEELKDKIKNLF